MENNEVITKLDQILERLDKIENRLESLKNGQGVGRTIGLALLADTIAETIKRPMK